MLQPILFMKHKNQHIAGETQEKQVVTSVKIEENKEEKKVVNSEN